jgi:hypothetical protein
MICDPYNNHEKYHINHVGFLTEIVLTDKKNWNIVECGIKTSSMINHNNSKQH